MSRRDRSVEVTGIVVALLIVTAIATWSSSVNRGEHFDLEQPTELVGARTCIAHGYRWYAFEAGGVRCYPRQRAGVWSAQETIDYWNGGGER